MNVFVLLWGCVVPYGEPLVSHIPKPAHQTAVDFSQIHSQIDSLLVGEQERGATVQLQELEHLLIKAKSWEVSAQQDLLSFAMSFVSQYQTKEVILDNEEPITQMEYAFDEVSLDEEAVGTEQSQRLQEAQQLVSEGKIVEAIQLMEECKTKPCWSDVYVFWAECTDKVFAEKCASIHNQQLPPNEDLWLWEQLGVEFSHPQHQTVIKKEKLRLQSILENAQ